MSEKEEIILILTGDKDELCDRFFACPANVDHCSECKLGIPRSEAVERMARIIFKELEPCLKPFYKVPKEKRGCIATAAEAALNALIKEI